MPGCLNVDIHNLIENRLGGFFQWSEDGIDSSIVDQHIKTAKRIERCIDHPGAPRLGRNVPRRRENRAIHTSERGANRTGGSAVHGDARAFPDGPPVPEAVEGEEPPPAPSLKNHLTESSADLRCLVMADVDFLSELWWTDPRMAGMGLVSPTADNGDFVLNAVELLSGDSNLAALRARGRYERPFKRVQELRRLAEAKFADKEQQLETELADARNRLNELQRERSDSQSLILNDQQREEVERFRDREIEISRELRAVCLELNKDIEALGTRLKLANVVGVPAAVALAAFAILGAGRRRRRN